MKQKLTWVFVLVFSGLLGLFLLVLTAPRSHVYDPRIDERNTEIVTKRPQDIMDAILAQAEGLPKQDVQIVETDISLPTWGPLLPHSDAILSRACESALMNPFGSTHLFRSQPMSTSLQLTSSTPIGTCVKSQ